METYNTQQAHIKLPQYGRYVQRLVDYCKAIPDRDRRNRCAAAVVKAMADLYKENNPGADISIETLWDHLARISGYELDVDYPCAIPERDELATQPQPIAYAQCRIRYRNYGKIIEETIRKACETQDRDARIMLLELVANQMKRIFHLQNPAAEEDDNKIIHDLLDYTEGQHSDDIYQVYLYPVRDLLKITQYDPAVVEPTGKKKKKKKK